MPVQTLICICDTCAKTLLTLINRCLKDVELSQNLNPADTTTIFKYEKHLKAKDIDQ